MAPKRGRFSSSSPSSKKTRGAKNLDEKTTSSEDVSRLLQDFTLAMKNSRPSPPDGDKETMSKQSEPRRLAMALKEKDVPIFKFAEIETLIKLKKRYGFTGRVVLEKSLVKEYELVHAAAVSAQMEIVE